jgi:hypothetical protein
MSVKERLKSFIKSENLSVSNFEKSISASNGYVNSISSGIGGSKSLEISRVYSKLSMGWILTGEGEMLKAAEEAVDLFSSEEKDIEVLYKEHMDFKRALKVIKNQDYKAYEIHKQTGLNESGLRRVLNNEIENPQAKTKKGIIQFARSIEPDLESQENTDFRDLKIDDKLNVLFNQMQSFKELENSINIIKGNIATVKEDVALNHEIVIKTDRALNIYSGNINLVLSEMKKESKKVIKLG